MTGHRYPVDQARQLGEFDPIAFSAALTQAQAQAQASKTEAAQDSKVQGKGKGQTKGQKGKKKERTLKDVLMSEVRLGPALVEHCIVEVGLSPRLPISQWDSNHTQALCTALGKAYELWTTQSLDSSPATAYIYLKDTPATIELDASNTPLNQQSSEKPASSTAGTQAERYADFAPFAYAQWRHKARIEFENLDRAVDAFYSHQEVPGQK